MPNFKGLYYEVSGSGKPLLLLHGWGANCKSFNVILKDLEQNFTVYRLDFYGFGRSESPPLDSNVFTYADAVYEFIESIICTKVVVLGHSFGGRIALIIGNRELIEKVILLDSAGLPPRFNIIKHFKVKRFKKLKNRVQAGKAQAKKLEKYGSSDYRELNENMKSVFVRVVNEDLTRFAQSLNKPTLILWGRKDKQTPLYMAKRLRKMIKNNQFRVVNGGHFSYLDEPTVVLKEIYNFIENY